MAVSRKKRVRFVCQSCGFVAPKWQGRCTDCEAWNSFVEEQVPDAQSRQRKTAAPAVTPLPEIRSSEEPRICFASAELNRVLGGGLVAGSLVLLGGDPGVGKSTLLLQQAAGLARDGSPVLYISGEESLRQIKLRADRLGVEQKPLMLLAETDMQAILAAIDEIKPALVVVDSIQTVFQPDLVSAPGSISQVRECALGFAGVAKPRGMPIVLIGHVTKEGSLAGPKVLEHMVDTLLQFEGDSNQQFRLLRTLKNRFGSTREIGIFNMSDTGLADVINPSELFLSHRSTAAAGSAVACTLEGNRPLLVEVQALVSASSYGTPQRTATGFDGKKLSMLLAVLEKRLGLRTGAHDVFLNVVGGVRLDEPAADFAVAAAICSSLHNQPVPDDVVLIGEIGLTGELRQVPQLDKRVHESAKLGFRRALTPAYARKNLRVPAGFTVTGCDSLETALRTLLDSA